MIKGTDAILNYLRTKRESISAHAAWGFAIFSIVHVRCGSALFIAILAVIVAGVAWEIGGEIVSAMLFHRMARRGGVGVYYQARAQRVSYVADAIATMRARIPHIWKASIPDALTFWIGWIAGVMVW